GRGPGVPAFFSDPGRPVGMISPHIDIRGGAACFAHGYHALATGQPSEVYVILGTGHAGVEKMFTATTLDFQTPLGTAEIDRELLELLAQELGRDPAEEEILHATEHVIEFQVIFLQHMLAGRHRFKILPILCSLSYQVFQDTDEFAQERTLFHEFCHALKRACHKSSKSICFIASADLDHIGPRYGDRFIPHKGTVSEALEKDEKMLRALEKVDVQQFVHQVAREKDARRICGFSPITAMMHCMEASRGNLLMLDYAHVDDKKSFVTFTSMIFH
ncbi:MAG: AmmeMemoRadiSam system protein B, partial [Deltaproteobacteria bacterium]|nr:AmmeMemoRadiSam system protein B [Deltaproteobacteria bacterium]